MLLEIQCQKLVKRSQPSERYERDPYEQIKYSLLTVISLVVFVEQLDLGLAANHRSDCILMALMVQSPLVFYHQVDAFCCFL